MFRICDGGTYCFNFLRVLSLVLSLSNTRTLSPSS